MGIEKRVSEFLSTVRVGIDFGQTCCGIAVVRGTEILDAATFVDYHESTLELRRQLRRGRRTRHAKKMRLARLRSWILRQKLPDGTRLPDPYKIMHDPRFQTKPGMFQVEVEKPNEAPSWVDKAKKGEVDADGFVCALTHIFRKRGFKYDDSEVEEMTDGALFDLLESCCELSSLEILKTKLKYEVDSRSKKKLSEAFERALSRKREPRKALPRHVKEEDLKQIIGAFGKNSGLSEQVIDGWKKQLCGLLNKFLRYARFDNRIKSGCSWCGKKTPRLKKPEVRKLAYEAAIRNLRVISSNGSQVRALNETEFAFFKDWFEKRAAKHEFKKGRGGEIFEHTPTKENIKKALGKIGASQKSYAMLPQLDNLLNRIPRSGRANLCREHLEMASKGKTMKDAGVDWQTVGERRARNPRLEQHDARVLKALEKMIFVRGKTGRKAWKHGPVYFITIEAPEPQTERGKKGQQTEFQPLSIEELLLKETGGVCIYQYASDCRARNGKLTAEQVDKEHIFPKSKGGPDIRINRVAACESCNTEKKNRLPSEWLFANGAVWKEYKDRVMKCSALPELKKQILLLEKGAEFPEDPTSLARGGARWRQFVIELRDLFKRYGVEPPQMNYEHDKPHVQKVSGRLSQNLRRSWLYKDIEANDPNFPEKNRLDLYNHAQDAGILAAVPPHTWRPQIFVVTAIRPCLVRDGDGKIKRDSKGKLLTAFRERPGLAVLELAPDWQAFLKERKSPVVRILGRLDKATWRQNLIDQTLYKDPEKKTEKNLRVHKPIDSPGGRVDGQRRETKIVPIGGKVVQVPYYDPTRKRHSVRKQQVKGEAKTIAVILWFDSKGNVHLSGEHPKALVDAGILNTRIDPPLVDCAKKVRWERGKTVWLQAKDKFPEGWYRLKEIGKNQLIMIPENNITNAIAEREGLLNEQIAVLERPLGKKEIADIINRFAG